MNSSAQLTGHYAKKDLVNKRVVAVTNIPPKRIAEFICEVLVLGVTDSHGEIVLLESDRPVPAGARIH